MYGNTCKCLTISIYAIIVIPCSIILIMQTLCASCYFNYDIFKNEEILINTTYYDICIFPNIQELYRNYSDNIYYQKIYDFNKSFNYAVIPIFGLLNIIFAGNFICYNRNKILFFFIGLLSLITQLAALLNKIYSDLNKRKLPELYNSIEDFQEIFGSYNDYKKIIPQTIYIIMIVLLFVQFIIFIFLIICVKIDSTKKNNKNCILLFHTVF